MFFRFALGWTLVMLFVVIEVEGQDPMRSRGSISAVELAADLNTTATARGAGSRSWVRAGERVYFHRFRERFHNELWRTDGTPTGTQLVREAGPLTSDRARGGELPDGRLLFVAYDPASGNELWISDGTPEGTRLYADICPGTCGSVSSSNFLRFGDEVIFQAWAGDRFRLYGTTGNQDGVRIVSELEFQHWRMVEDQIFMTGEGPDIPLWVSGGEASSEHLVAMLDLRSVSALRALGSRILIAGFSEQDELELRIGDADGVEQFANLGDFAFQRLVAGPTLAYLTSDTGLWRTDGSAEGTLELPAVPADGRGFDDLGLVGDHLFFFLDDRYLWTSDGSIEGTRLLRDFGEPESTAHHPSRMTALAGRACFFAHEDGAAALWCSDGSSAGTVAVRGFSEIDGRFFDELPMGVLDDRLIFAADGGGTGLELWSSDGTTDGTRLVANLTGDAASSDPRGFARRGQEVTFTAHRGDPGTALFHRGDDGVVELDYVSERRASSVLTVLGDQVIFADFDGARDGPTRVLAIDRSDGSVLELLEVSRVWWTWVAGSRLYLATGVAAGSGGHPFVTELWSSDGTPEDTVRLVPGVDGSPFPDSVFYSAIVGNRLFFTAKDEAHGTELWMTDGTPAGTRLVQDLYPGPESSEPGFLAFAGERLYVRARTSEANGSLIGFNSQGAILGSVEFPGLLFGARVTDLGDRLLWMVGAGFNEPEDLWVSDLGFSPPTLLGTFVGIQGLTAAGEGALIERRRDLNEIELWVTDGTPEGTELRETLLTKGPFVRGADRVFFSAATPEHGEELWVSDGTFTGTRLVADVQPGPESSSPFVLLTVDGGVMFSARTAAVGRELWSSNGESAGTRLLGDTAPGPRGSHPQLVTAATDAIVFSAYRDDVGREPFSVPRSALAPACTPSETSLCLNQGRFRVEVVWRDFEGGTGPGRPVPISVEDSGLLYFFDPDNWEMLIKVLDGCAINNRYWVFAAATTDVEYTLTVTDTTDGEHVEYFNTLGNASPAITDTEAFATCP